MSVSDVCRDVRLFLRSLAGELPEVFPAPPPRVLRRRYYYRPVRVRRASLSPADRRQAKELISARVRHWAGVLGLEYNRICIKDQHTLWGSCSGKKNLNFNWRLTAATPEALDYVVIHELCHLREMNHSNKFWAHVGAACPDYKVHRKWLRKNCVLLKSADAPGFIQAPAAPSAGFSRLS